MIGPLSKSRAYSQTSGVPDTTSEGAHGPWSIAHVRPSLTYTSRADVFLGPENETDLTSRRSKMGAEKDGSGAKGIRPAVNGLALGGRLIGRGSSGQGANLRGNVKPL